MNTEKHFEIVYHPSIAEKIKTYSDTRREQIKEKLVEIEIYLATFPEMYGIYDFKTEFRSFSIKFSKNDGYNFLYTIDKKHNRVFISEFYHFREEF